MLTTIKAIPARQAYWPMLCINPQSKEAMNDAVIANITQLDIRVNNRIDQLDKETKECFIKVDKRFDQFEKSVDERFAKVDKRFDEFEKRVDERFAKVDKRFDQFEKSVNEQFTEVKTDIKLIYGKLDSIDQRFSDIDKRFSQLTWLLSVFMSAMAALVGVSKFI